MDVLKLIKKDHDSIRELFAILENMDEDSTTETEENFYELRSLLLNHSKAEELVLYSRIEEVEETKKYALEGTQEHDIVEYLLTKLEGLPLEDRDRWQATLCVLKDTVDHHLQAEEKEMFKVVKKEFNAEEREEMAIQFQDEKHSLTASTPKLNRRRIYEEITSRL